MDVSGESQIDVISNVFKQRLHLDGMPVDAEVEKHGECCSHLSFQLHFKLVRFIGRRFRFWLIALTIH